MKTTMLALAAGLLMAAPSWAGDCGCGCGKEEAGCASAECCGSPTCCAHCGRCCDCDKCCQVVPYVKEVKKTVWAVKCEDFCPSLPGCPLGGCGDCCESGDSGDSGGILGACKRGCCNCDVCAVELEKRQTPPKCAAVHTRKILEKKEVVCKVPSYKCVVVYCCPNCMNSGPGASGSAEPKPSIPAPAPPAAKPQKLPPPPKTTGTAPEQPEVAASGMAGF